MVPKATSSHAWEENTKQEEEEAQHLLFNDEVVRGQLLSELSSLAMGIGEFVEDAVPTETLNIRLMLHVMEVASVCPVLGTLLLESPLRLDKILNKTLGRWFQREAAVASAEGQYGASQSICHHLSPASRSSTMHTPSNDGHGCPICPWTLQWPSAFWEALCCGATSVTVRCAPSALPSFLAACAHHSPIERPCDMIIGAEQWVQVVGHTTSVFFLHRELSDPVPMVELQPLVGNHGGFLGQPPLWLDLSVLPQSEVREVAVVGELLHVVGLLDVISCSLGMVLYSKRGNASSSTHLVLEVRTAHTPRFTSKWSHDPLIAPEIVTPLLPSLSLVSDCQDTFDLKDELETHALLQAKCCWESVAGAAAFASAKAVGGFHQPHGACRVEAIFAASNAFVLPTALWAVIGMALSSTLVLDGNLVASVVGPSDTLSVLKTFLLELGAETNMLLPVLHGMEPSLLPTYARISPSQAAIPMKLDAGRWIESVRGGLLNMAHQRVLFIPSLHALSASGLHAIQGILEEHEHIVVREGAKRLNCRAVGTVISITQESMLMQNRHLFYFLERGDVVIHISPSFNRSFQEQADVVLGMVPLSGSLDDVTLLEFVKRCKRQWDTFCGWAMSPVDVPPMPQLSPACATMLHTFFISAKAIFGEAADASMMNTLVKLTCTHALLRQKVHHRFSHKTVNVTGSAACACHAAGMEGDNSTALVDAIVAITLCNASQKFVVGTSLIGEPSFFELIAGDDQFSVVQFSRQFHRHLLCSLSGIRE